MPLPTIDARPKEKALPHAGRSSKRRAILEGALSVFLSEGYASANMDRIAEVAGVSKKTIYNHFGSKDDLFMEIVGAMVDEILEPLGSPAPQPAEVEEALLDFAQRYAEVILSERRLMLHRLVMGEITRFPNLGAYYNSGYARATSGVAQMLERLARRGQLQIADFGHAATCFWQLTIAESHNELLFAPTLKRTDLDLTRRLTRGVGEFLMIYGRLAAGVAR